MAVVVRGSIAADIPTSLGVAGARARGRKDVAQRRQGGSERRHAFRALRRDERLETEAENMLASCIVAPAAAA